MIYDEPKQTLGGLDLRPVGVRVLGLAYDATFAYAQNYSGS